MVCAPLTDEQFERARCLALRLTGIELLDRHRGLLQRRRARLAQHAFDAWLGAAEEGDGNACRRLIELFTTTFTGFFRHVHHFHLAAERAVRAVHRRGTARMWSAAAATGEEPYSLAMTLIEAFQCEDPPVTILATDIHERALEVARNGGYSEAALGALPPLLRTRFFGERADGGHRYLLPAVRRLVAFRQLNLTDVVWPVDGVFDVVFCRNLLMYLDACHRYAVLERIASILEPDGLLLLDPSEHVGRAASLFVDRGNGAYSRLPVPGRPSGRQGYGR
jgi:chemotaxis protein methyltransferase CheR